MMNFNYALEACGEEILSIQGERCRLFVYDLTVNDGKIIDNGKVVGDAEKLIRGGTFPGAAHLGSFLTGTHQELELKEILVARCGILIKIGKEGEEDGEYLAIDHILGVNMKVVVEDPQENNPTNRWVEMYSIDANLDSTVVSLYWNDGDNRFFPAKEILIDSRDRKRIFVTERKRSFLKK